MALDMKYFEEMEAKIPKGKVRTRFAPSPTGYMHVGNLRTALYTWLIARHHRRHLYPAHRGHRPELGRWRAPQRSIYRTLAECGLDPRRGPRRGRPGGPLYPDPAPGHLWKVRPAAGGKGRTPTTASVKRPSRKRTPASSTGLSDPCRALSQEEAQARVDAGEPYVIRQKIPSGGTTTFHDAIFGDITVENEHPGRPGAHQAGRPAHL